MLLAVTVIVGLITIWLLLSQRRRYRFADSLPQLKPWFPVVGNGALMFGKSDVDRFDVLVKIFRDYDRMVRVWAGPKMLLFTSHPDLVQQLLTSPACLEKPFLYSFAGFEQGLFTSKYKLWRSMRKRLNSSFNLRILHGFIPVFVQCARKMVEDLNENPDGTVVSMHKFTSVCTLEMACGTTLGSDITRREGKEEFVHGLDIAFGEAARRMVSVHLYPNIVYHLTKYHRELVQARGVVCDFFSRLVTERRNTMSLNCNKKTNEEELDFDRKPKILIDQLLSVNRDGKSFSDTEIEDNIYAVITGANDTSGLLIAHACLFLCFYKDIEEKLFTEIMEFMPNEEFEINPESLKQLSYLEKFLKECLRHCPVAPNISRENMSEIEIDGMKVPPGNIFIMNFYALHRRKDIWGPDADKFDPEQFSEERSRNRHPFAYLPFSGGNRICIGWRYAMFSMKVMLIYLIRNFQFETEIRPEQVRYRHDLTMKLPFEHMIKVTRRKLEGSTVMSDILKHPELVPKEGRE
ncbi:AAEL005700-PA [Aedes aegypti]|uniref:AAEL005700-PA n=1 Tax=Aedes aegypti TaxID=7159 RepID=Q179B7_AEDAE|nr:AAEL005700-PA [Aedes aegypti]